MFLLPRLPGGRRSAASPHRRTANTHSFCLDWMADGGLAFTETLSCYYTAKPLCGPSFFFFFFTVAKLFLSHIINDRAEQSTCVGKLLNVSKECRGDIDVWCCCAYSSLSQATETAQPIFTPK